MTIYKKGTKKYKRANRIYRAVRTVRIIRNKTMARYSHKYTYRQLMGKWD